jgi:hypothetical protein
MGLLDDLGYLIRGDSDQPWNPNVGYEDLEAGGEWDLAADWDDWEVGGDLQNAVPAVTALGGLRPVLISIEDFRSTGAPWLANQWTAVTTFRVPRGIMQRLPAGRSYRFYVRAARRGLPGAIVGARTITGLTGLVQTLRVVPALPSIHHPDVVIWTRAGAVWTQQAVTAVDYTAGSASFTAAAAHDEAEVYYTHGLGEWRLRVHSPLGQSDTAAMTVANSAFSATHTVDQNNAETTHRWPRLTVMVPGQNLVLEANTPAGVEVIHNDRSLHVLTLESFVNQVAVTDPQQLRQLAELALREG